MDALLGIDQREVGVRSEAIVRIWLFELVKIMFQAGGATFLVAAGDQTDAEVGNEAIIFEHLQSEQRSDERSFVVASAAADHLAVLAFSNDIGSERRIVPFA